MYLPCFLFLFQVLDTETSKQAGQGWAKRRNVRRKLSQPTGLCRAVGWESCGHGDDKFHNYYYINITVKISVCRILSHGEYGVQ